MSTKLLGGVPKPTIENLIMFVLKRRGIIVKSVSVHAKYLGESTYLPPYSVFTISQFKEVRKLNNLWSVLIQSVINCDHNRNYVVIVLVE